MDVSAEAVLAVGSIFLEAMKLVGCTAEQREAVAKVAMSRAVADKAEVDAAVARAKERKEKEQ